MNANIINVGDKIDIRVFKQVDLEQKTGEKPKIYKSMVQDIKAEGLLEISMPVEAGKMILLPMGVRLEFVLYSQNALYRFSAQVKERYKVKNMYMLLIEMKSSLEKLQRREYYRFECVMDMWYQSITEEETQIEDMEELKVYHKSEFPDSIPEKAIAVDISGGGIRFTSDKQREKGEFLLITIKLQSTSIDSELEIASRLLSCRRIESDSNVKKYEYRVEFITNDQKKREMIIKYIFEQERKSRQKG